MTHAAPQITLQTLPSQPILFMTRRVPRSDIARALGECLPAVFVHCQREGIAMVGPPLARYVDMGVGLWTLQAGMPVAEGAEGQGNIESGTLPAGLVATAVHVGPYEALGTTHAAIETWLAEQGHVAAGGPWESYVTDPGEEPDPQQWRTQLYWPVEGK